MGFIRHPISPCSQEAVSQRGSDASHLTCALYQNFHRHFVFSELKVEAGGLLLRVFSRMQVAVVSLASHGRQSLAYFFERAVVLWNEDSVVMTSSEAPSADAAYT